METPALLASMDQKAIRVGEVSKEVRAPAVKLVMTDYKASKARLERMENRVHPDLPANQVELVLLASRDLVGPLDPQETPALRAHPVQTAHPAPLDLRGQKVHRVIRGLLETMGTLESLGI